MASRSGADQYGHDGTFDSAPASSVSDPLGGLVTGGALPKPRETQQGQQDAVPQPVEPIGPDAEAVRKAMDDLLAEESPAQQEEQATEEPAQDDSAAPPRVQGPRAWPGRPTGELVRMAWRPVQNRLRPSGGRKALHDEPDTPEQAKTAPSVAEHRAGRRRGQGIPAGAVAVFALCVAFVVVAYFMVVSFVNSVSNLFS